MDRAADLAHGWSLLFAGHFRDSLVPLSSAARDFRWAAQALYGMGVAHLSLGEEIQAESALWESLRRAPQNADALFYLGLVAERRGRRQEANSRYQEVLALAPDHPHARVRLAALRAGSSVRPRVVPLPPAPPAAPRWTRPKPSPPPPPEPAELAPPPAETLELAVRPRLLAFLGSLDRDVVAPLPVNPATALVLLAFWAGLSVLRVRLPMLGSLVTLFQVAALAGVVLQLLGLGLTVVRVRRMRTVIRDGKVWIERDLLRPGGVSVDLAQVAEVQLLRPGLNRLTGDGSLAFLTGRGTVLVTGVAHGLQLLHLYHRLVDQVGAGRG